MAYRYCVGGWKSKIILAVCWNNDILNSRGIGFDVSNQLSKFSWHSVPHGIGYVQSSCSSLYNFTQNLIQELPLRPGVCQKNKSQLVFYFFLFVQGHATFFFYQPRLSQHRFFLTKPILISDINLQTSCIPTIQHALGILWMHPDPLFQYCFPLVRTQVFRIIRYKCPRRT